MIVGKRVRLRAINEDDLPRFVDWFNDPDVTQGLARIMPINLQEERRWFEDSLRKDVFERPFSIDVLEGDTWLHVGSCGFFNHDPQAQQAELGIVLGDKRYWDQGLGTETVNLLLQHGFETLNFQKITLRVFEFNPRARKVYERVGFVLEGRLRRDVYRRGRYWDTLVMGILRMEWPIGPDKED
jgi:RimJ/RimL family protein N-acetyltransferase